MNVVQEMQLSAYGALYDFGSIRKRMRALQRFVEVHADFDQT